MSIINILRFFYTYYRTYILFSFEAAAAIISFRLITRHFGYKIDITKKAILAFFLFVCYMILAYLINKHPAIDNVSVSQKAILYFTKAAILFFAALIGTAICTVCCVKINTCTTPPIKNKLINNRFGILCFLILILQFIYNCALKINSWVAPTYVIHYGLGFISRGFIGSLLHLISPDFISASLATRFLKLCLIIIILLLSFIINEAVKKCNYNKGIIFLCLLYVCCPGSVSAMWNYFNFSRLETFVFLVTLISIIIFNYLKDCLYLKYITITILSCIGIAIYQGGIFLYYPEILLIIACDCLTNIKDRKRWLPSIGSVLITGATFLIFQFGSHINFDSYEALREYVISHTDLDMDTTGLLREYFGNIVSSFYDTIPRHVFTMSMREYTFITLCILAPLIILFIALWMKLLKCDYDKTSYSKNEHRLCLFALILYLAFVPQFVLNCDWQRWLIAVIFYSFFAIIYLHYIGLDASVSTVDSLTSFIENHKVIAIGILIYMASLSKISDGWWAFLTETEKLLPRLNNILDILERLIGI